MRDESFPDSKPGINNVSGTFKQFIAEDTVYMSTEIKYRRYKNAKVWDLPWEKPKVIVPASRISRGAWRFAAVIDKGGCIASRRFYCIWPKGDTFSIEILAAVLNSPIAAAFVYSHSFQRYSKACLFCHTNPIYPPEAENIIHVWLNIIWR